MLQIMELLKKLPTAQVLQILRKYWQHIAVFIVTATGCWYLWSPAPPKLETYKPEAKQADGSIVVERKPDPEAHAAMLLPKGAKLQRKITVTVQAKNPVQAISGTVTVEEIKTQMKLADVPGAQTVTAPETVPDIECPAVTLDLALVKMPDASQRVIASSQDGNILGSVDIPVESAKPPAEPKNWSVGIVGDPFRQTIGAFVDWRFGWGMVGAEIMQREYMGLPGQFNVKTGINF